MIRNRTVVAAALLLSLLGTSAFGVGAGETAPGDLFDVAVFVPGVVEGSPTYELLVAGVERAVEEAEGGATVQIVEGGFNQSLWQEGVTSLAASRSFDLIVTSNPSMPEIAAAVAESFPEQRFLVLDGYLEGNDAIHTVLFNQREQGFLSGYFAGLVTTSDMEDANPETRVGLLAGQEFPIMNGVILPSYELGLKAAVPEGTVDFRILGNWYDASKASDLASNMIDGGVDTILAIAGGGNQGVISSARQRGAYVLWYDTSGYEEAPGIVIGSSIVRLDRAAYEKTLQAIEGGLPYGEAVILGAREGYVTYDTEHREFERHVPEPIREELDAMLQRLQTGDLVLDMPTRF
jgi:riboflavin transport system substrate-binding protein